MSDRYTGKPFLKLLDCYVLDAIGHLNAKSDAKLRALAPPRGDWRAIVEEQMQFPKGTAGAIREVWEKGKPRFVEAHGHDPDPGEFTTVFVDTNFPH